MTGYNTFVVTQFFKALFNYLLLPCLLRKNAAHFGCTRDDWFLLWIQHTCDSGHFPAMASDGLSGQKIPEEYGKATPFFRSGALIVA